MAKLPDFRGYWFQRGIEVLRRSVQTGLVALDSEKDTLEQQLESYRQSGKFEGERDEDGSILWEQDMFFEHEIASVNEASAELRKAFAIAAYHFWERSVQSWIAHENGNGSAKAEAYNTPKQKKRIEFEDLCELTKVLGYSVSGKLVRVQALANMLKHNNERWGKRLLMLWPDVFVPGLQESPKPYDGFSLCK